MDQVEEYTKDYKIDPLCKIPSADETFLPEPVAEPDSDDESLEEMIKFNDSYKNVPLRFSLKFYLDIPQLKFYEDLNYYKDHLRENARKILSPLTTDQLEHESYSLGSKMYNVSRISDKKNPKTRPDDNFELPQNIYREVINELLHEKRFPHNPSRHTLFKQFISVIEKSEKYQLVSRNDKDHELTIGRPYETIFTDKWTAKLTKEEGQPVWIFHDGICMGFTISHYNALDLTNVIRTINSCNSY